VLFQNMTDLWKWVIRALVLSGVGVVLLAVAAVWSDGVEVPAVVVAAAAGIAIAISGWWRKCAPRLGTED
jgi:hypothetical protein